MSILDFDDHYVPPFNPKGTGRRPLSEEKRLAELNNLGRKEVTEDFSDMADRIPA